MRFTLFFLVFVLVASSSNISDPFEWSSGVLDLRECHDLCVSRVKFNCNCQKKSDFYYDTPECIPTKWLCDGEADCPDGSDEVDCICPPGEFQCSNCKEGGACNGSLLWNYYQCISQEMVGDGYLDCLTEKDEIDEICTPCDGYLDCPQRIPHDEANCTTKCPSNETNPCECNKEEEMTCTGLGAICYNESQRCDLKIDCVDSSDEIGCLCEDDQFTCQCYKKELPDCSFKQACIPKEKYHDEKQDCPDGSDEILFLNERSCGQCNLTVHRMNNTAECNQSSYPSCDSSTCYKTPSLNCSTNDCNTFDMICTSNCSDNITEPCDIPFQCSDGNLIFHSQFCDGETTCPDNSDEMRNQPGFKCTLSTNVCVLPQRNLYDDVAHCDDESDLCDDNNISCFECFDKRLLISSKQLCDGVIDCFDLSDECLCGINIDKPLCNALFTLENNSTTLCAPNRRVDAINSTVFIDNPKLVYALFLGSEVNLTHFVDQRKNKSFSATTKHCETKHGDTIATLCDGRPECRDFSDECNCEEPPSFCNDTCRSFYKSFYPLGDRYCDGIEDELAWNWGYINKSACPRGFDENLCPKRFRCKSGDDVSIDVLEVCNGVVNCDDGSDENKCSSQIKEVFSSYIGILAFRESLKINDIIFSSDTEMIANISLRSAFWIIGIIVIIGNVIAIITKVRFLRKAKLSGTLRCQHLVILNISIADFMMGIYLLAIGIFSALFSGYYGEVDVEWRTSLRCSIIGSLAIISSEASCFLIVIITAFRLYGICNPFASKIVPSWPWKLCICGAWLISLTLGILPIIHRFVGFPYFVKSISFSIQFNIRDIWNVFSLTNFACRFAAMANKTINCIDGCEWKGIQNFLEANFLKNLPLKVFGYYGETSVCMPRFYVERRDSSWEYSLAIITINFMCFVFVVVGYIFILNETRKSSQNIRKSASSNSGKKSSKTEKRVARIILTDLCCWIPICVLAYVRVSGIHFDAIVYQISAVFLLPVNSALNPFLYSSLLDKLMEKMTSCKKK